MAIKRMFLNEVSVKISEIHAMLLSVMIPG